MKKSTVFFLVGNEPLQERLFFEKLQLETLKRQGPGMDDVTIDAKTQSLSEAFDLANTMPMWGGQRLITIRNAGAPKEADEEQWLAYLQNPSPNAIVIGTAEKIDKRTKFAKALEKAGALVLFEAPGTRELASWVGRLAERHAVTLSPEAKLALAEAVGSNLAALDQEIGKLALYVYPKTRIEEADVAQLVLQVAGDGIFAWTDQVVESKLAQAIQTTRHLLGQGTPPLVLVSMLARHLRILLKAQHHLRKRTERMSLAPALGVPPFVVGRYLDQAKRFSSGSLRKSIGELAQLDMALKSTGLPAEMLLERSIRTIATSAN